MPEYARKYVAMATSSKSLARALITDEALRGLPDDTHRLFYVWLQLRADNIGRMRASEHLLKGEIYEDRDDVTLEACCKMRDKLHEVGLLVVYIVAGIRYAQDPQHLSEGRNKLVGGMLRSSEYPPPPAEALAQWEQLTGRTIRAWERGIYLAPARKPSFSDIGGGDGAFAVQGFNSSEVALVKSMSALAARRSGLPTDVVLRQLSDELSALKVEYPTNFLHALRETVGRGKCDPRYMRAILRNMGTQVQQPHGNSGSERRAEKAKQDARIRDRRGTKSDATAVSLENLKDSKEVGEEGRKLIGRILGGRHVHGKNQRGGAKVEQSAEGVAGTAA